MKKLLSFLKKYKKEAILAPLFKMFEALLDLAVPLVIALIVGRGLPPEQFEGGIGIIGGGGDSGIVIRYCLLLVLLGVLGLGASVVAQYFAARAAVGTGTALRSAVFARVQGLSYSELDRVGTSTLINRMTSDVGQVQTGVNMTLRLFLRSPFIVFGSLVLALLIDVPSALVFCVVIPVLAAIVFGIILSTVPLYRGVQARLDRVLGRTRQHLTGVRVLRAFGQEDNEVDAFCEENRSLSLAQRFVGRLSALLNPLTYILLNLAIVILIRVGAIRIDHGILTRGQVIALYNYMSQILVELVKLANLIVTMTRSAACMRRVSDVLDLESSLRETPDPDSVIGEWGEISFEDLSLRYAGAGADALTGIDLRVAPGETLGIIGGTGSGKSSLVGLVPHFYDCTAGKVLVGGVNVQDIPTDLLRSHIGIVPQRAVLFKGTIRENLLWGRSAATDAELWEALEAAQAAEIVRGKEGQLDAPVEQEGRNLSGGQRQRLTIARALVRRPDILILDDSASALDFATEAALRRTLRDLPWHPTILIVSQRTSSIMHADRILVLEDGAPAGLGRHEELLASSTVYREIAEAQGMGGERDA